MFEFSEWMNRDEDDPELQAAINESLNYALMPPSRAALSMEKPNESIAVKKLRLLIEQGAEIQNRIESLTSINVAQQSERVQARFKNKEPQVKETEQLNTSQEIRNQQDQEFEEALIRAQIEDINENQEEEEAAEEENSNYNSIIIQQYQSLGPEPAVGVSLALVMPNGEKITRKFGKTSLGEQLYIWAASQQEMINSNKRINDIEIVAPTGEVLSLTSTLEQQNITVRSLLHLRLKE